MLECSVLVVIIMEGKRRRAKELGAFSSAAAAEELLQLTRLQHEHHDWKWMEDESVWRYGELLLRVQRIKIDETIAVGQNCYIAVRLLYDEEVQIRVLRQGIQLKRWHADVLCAGPNPAAVVGRTMQFIQQSKLTWEVKENYNWHCAGRHIQIFQRKIAQ